MSRFKIFVAFLAIAIGCQPPQQSVDAEIQRVEGVIGKSAMVVAAHPLASAIGLDILKRGGNAFDAAVAVHFALQVTFPEAGNIGGGGFLLYRQADGQIGSLDFREKAPASAFRDMYLDENGEVIPMLSRIGHKAAGVPGSVAGMWAMHEKFGSKPWSSLIQPSVELSFTGYKLTQNAVDNLNDKQEDFKKTNRFRPWVIKDGGWKKGDSCIQKELATTLSFIQNKGRDGFYKGIVADQIVKEMQLGGGLITAADLENYQPQWRTPLVGDYKGYRVISMPPPSSGGVAIIQLLQGANQYDFSQMRHNSAEMIHLKTELERRVYADRATYLGDPDFYEVPVAMLTDPNYNQDRYSDIKKKRKTPSSEIKEGEVEILESMQTTHYSIVDKDGNAVSVTTTLNGYYGCKVMVKGAGFFLNNEMDDFSAKPGVPNMFGLVGAEANAIAPGKRMLSSMTPTIVDKGDNLFMVTGTPGGATIITSVFQSIVNVIDYGMTMQEAVNAPRFHSQWLPDRSFAQSGSLSASDSLELTSYGHEIEPRNRWGSVDAILVREDGSYEGAADATKGDDTALGY